MSSLGMYVPWVPLGQCGEALLICFVVVPDQCPLLEDMEGKGVNAVIKRPVRGERTGTKVRQNQNC